MNSWNVKMNHILNSLQVELDNLHEIQKNSQKIYIRNYHEKRAPVQFHHTLKYLYQHQMDILN